MSKGCVAVAEMQLAKRPKSKFTVAKHAVKRVGFINPPTKMSVEEFNERESWQAAFDKRCAELPDPQ